jgi:D-glycero-alpha-D-manno-heptose-7-phosphate kinase
VRAFKVKRGVDLWVHSDAPPGSGLGSSSTLVVALIGVMAEWLKQARSGYEIAELAYHIERVEMKLAGGRQDQYASAFGGFNFIEFHRDSTLVNPLRIRTEVIAELEYRLLLCYMGQTRQSAQIIERQVESYREGKTGTVEALHRLKAETLEMKRALLMGDIDGMGELLHQAWENKKKLDHAISNPHVDGLYQLARKEGAIGGKMPGAGGGGYFLLLTRFDRKHRVAAALERHGGQVVPFQFERRGMTAWASPGPAPRASRGTRKSGRCASGCSGRWRPGAAGWPSTWRCWARRCGRRPRCAGSRSPASTRISCSRASRSSTRARPARAFRWSRCSIPSVRPAGAASRGPSRRGRPEP